MKFVILIGSGAVGKMTVGQALMERTGLRLFHNHMTIEPVIEIFGAFHGRASNRIRQVIFEEFLNTDLPGMIFTYMWAFDHQEDWDYINQLTDQFKSHGADVYYVELIASQEVRLQRNRTENRLKHKASKKDIALSEQRLLREDANYRLISKENEIPYNNYLRLDNTFLSPEEAAEIIQNHFRL